VTTGKFLAHVLVNVKAFEECCISLVGFSLGTVVILSCLLELLEMKCYDLLYDVFLIGGVANVKEFVELNLHMLVANKLVNVYSKQDWVISNLLKMAHWDIVPVGSGAIEVNSRKVVNIDKTGMIRGVDAHWNYREILDHILRSIDVNDGDFIVEEE